MDPNLTTLTIASMIDAGGPRVTLKVQTATASPGADEDEDLDSMEISSGLSSNQHDMFVTYLCCGSAGTIWNNKAKIPEPLDTTTTMTCWWVLSSYGLQNQHL